jgi:hypothetical protein
VPLPKTICPEHRVPHRQHHLYAKRIFLRELAWGIPIFFADTQCVQLNSHAGFWCMGVIPNSEDWGRAIIMGELSECQTIFVVTLAANKHEE